MDISKTEIWIKNNARPIDVAKWQHIFNDDPKEDIVTQLLFYQNADGGFGNGLEADIIMPQSNAITSAGVISLAYEYKLDCTQSWFSRLLDYFENSMKPSPIFWEPVPPEIENYARPPWWNYQLPTKFSPNPSATIASSLIAYGTDNQQEIGGTVMRKCFHLLLSDEKLDEHECYCLIDLIEKLLSIDSPLITDNVVSAMRRRITENVCHDKSGWDEYNAQPMDFARHPSSIWYSCVSDSIQANIKYWLDNINADGVWMPNFSWGEGSPEARQATKDWMGFIAVNRAKILKNYGVI